MTTTLSPRELEALKLSANGLHGKEIAAKMFIVDGTVKRVLDNARTKLGSVTTTHSVALAIKRGDIKLEDIE